MHVHGEHPKNRRCKTNFAENESRLSFCIEKTTKKWKDKNDLINTQYTTLYNVHNIAIIIHSRPNKFVNI